MTEQSNVVPITGRDDPRPVDLIDRKDDELLLLARGGREEAFAVVVRRHQEKVLRLASRYLGGDTELAEEAAQRTFVELFRYLPRYERRGRFSQFLYQLLLNQCRMVFRTAAAEQRKRSGIADHSFEPAALPDEQLLARERRRSVDRAISRLSEKLRVVVALRFAGDMPYDEIAQVLELPMGTVKSRLAAGMEKLRQLMEEDRP